MYQPKVMRKKKRSKRKIKVKARSGLFQRKKNKDLFHNKNQGKANKKSSLKKMKKRMIKAQSILQVSL